MVMLGTDMKVAETPKGLEEYDDGDAYEAWLKNEGVKVYEEFYFPSLAKIELGPWERKGGKGAVIHIPNRHMPTNCHVIGGVMAATRWQGHDGNWRSPVAPGRNSWRVVGPITVDTGKGPKAAGWRSGP